jgi:hypothetical protein
MSTRTLGTLFAVTFLACWLAVPSFADSQARIVRLSQVDGDVQIDRNTGQGYEKAFVNLPITQGVKLRSGNQGRAEVEFEDGSTLRITPGTVVEFSELARRDSGARASGVNLQTGTAYLNFKGDKSGQEFLLGFGPQKLSLTKSAHMRIEMKDADATLAVFKGEVKVEGAAGTVEVEKKHSATFDLGGTNPYTLANSLEPDPYDEWDKQQEKYHQQYSLSASNSYSPYAYGTSDLNYYGSFYSVPGYGMMWQPYLVGAGWDPFMNGAWMWYPGSGYAWVSAYPWGWTPYRYGSWTYLSAYGWFWQPGNSWAGWNTGPSITNPPRQFNFPRPPATPGQTLVVNRSTPSAPAGLVQNRIQFSSGSAGLGVPRGSVRDLGKISRQVERSPIANRTLQTPMSGSAARPPASSRVSSPHGGPPPRSSMGTGGGSPRMSAPSSSRSSAPSSSGSPHR